MLNDISEAIRRLGGLEPTDADGLRPLTEDDLTTIERLIGQELPSDYRAFALTYGKCSFTNLVACEVDAERLIYISSFYGGGNEPATSILCAIDAYEGRGPEESIPIVECAEQGEICLAFGADEYGKIFFWGRQFGIIQIATSFTDFFNKLIVIEED